MQLITSEIHTATTTDKTARLLLENVIGYWLTKQNNRRFIVVPKYQLTTVENLNPEILQQILRLESRFKSQVLYELFGASQIKESIPIKIASSTTPKVYEETTNLEEQGIKIVRDRLIELLQSEDEDEYGILKPTPHAFATAWKLVSDASELMRKSFPKASASTDDKGGIRLTWTRLKPEIEVRLICPYEPSKKTYLYHETSEKHGTIDDVTALALASWLQWFNKA